MCFVHFIWGKRPFKVLLCSSAISTQRCELCVWIKGHVPWYCECSWCKKYDYNVILKQMSKRGKTDIWVGFMKRFQSLPFLALTVACTSATHSLLTVWIMNFNNQFALQFPSPVIIPLLSYKQLLKESQLSKLHRQNQTFIQQEVLTSMCLQAGEKSMVASEKLCSLGLIVCYRY